MQEAVKTKSLDAINAVFADLAIEDAEDILDTFQEGGFIGINALLEDEDQFKELQDHYKNEQSIEELNIEDEQISINEQPTNTSDIVD